MSDRAPQNNELRRVMDACLPGLENKPGFDQNVIKQVRGDTKVKKKLSVGFVLMIVLVLTVVAALAAITLSEFYEKAIQKEGESGLIQDWSADDQAALVDWMIDAGIELDVEKVARLHDTGLTDEEKSALAMEIITDYYPARDGILSTVDIIAKEKGPVEYWSLEDKAWFSELMLEYQPDQIGGVNLLPGEGDITQEEAIEIMYAYFKDTYGLERGEFDETTMSVSFAEATWDDGSGPELLTTWGIEIWLKTDSDHSLGVSILPDGTMKEAHGPYVPNWRDDWYDTYIGESLGKDFWTIEGTYAFSQSGWAQRVADLQAQDETIYANLLHLLTKHFGLPGETDITPDEALLIANLAVSETLNLTDDDMRFYQIRRAYLLDDYEFPVYFFWYLRSAETQNLDDAEKERLVQMVVLINATDGSIVRLEPTSGLSFAEIV